MITKTFKQLGEVSINTENCTDVIEEAMQIMILATETRTKYEYERVRSFRHSQSIKRGIKWKKENGYKRSKEFGASK